MYKIKYRPNWSESNYEKEFSDMNQAYHEYEILCKNKSIAIAYLFKDGEQLAFYDSSEKKKR